MPGLNEAVGALTRPEATEPADHQRRPTTCRREHGKELSTARPSPDAAHESSPRSRSARRSDVATMVSVGFT